MLILNIFPLHSMHTPSGPLASGHTCRYIVQLTIDPWYLGTPFHSATIILVPEKLSPVLYRMKVLTLFIWESEAVNCVYFTDPLLLVSISAANGATTAESTHWVQESYPEPTSTEVFLPLRNNHLLRPTTLCTHVHVHFGKQHCQQSHSIFGVLVLVINSGN